MITQAASGLLVFVIGPWSELMIKCFSFFIKVRSTESQMLFYIKEVVTSKDSRVRELFIITSEIRENLPSSLGSLESEGKSSPDIAKDSSLSSLRMDLTTFYE